jgi:hypothetical protein
MTIIYRGVESTLKKIKRKKTFSGIYRGIKFEKDGSQKVKINREELLYRGTKIS